jgi:hypothetical protein
MKYRRTGQYRMEEEVVIRFPTDEFYKGDYRNGVVISGSLTTIEGGLTRRVEIDLGDKSKNGKRK